MSEKQRTISRRGVLRGIAGATAATGAATAGANLPPAVNPVGEAEAVIPLVLAGGAVGGSLVGLGWTIGEHTASEADSPADGLSAEALEEQVYQTAQARKSNNASTFIDNQNILDGAEHVAWADGKIAAIDALNDQATQADVTTAGQEAVDAYETTIKTNLLKSWNESVQELRTLATALDDHPDTGFSGVLTTGDFGDSSRNDGGPATINGVNDNSSTITLPDGSDLTVQEMNISVSFENNSGSNFSTSGIWEPTSSPSTPADEFQPINEGFYVVISGSDGDVEYLNYQDWNSIWSAIETNCQNVRDGISLWVDGVYDQVQAGELETADLLTPREIAELSSEDEEEFNQAVADLMALNVPTNLDREAEVYIEEIGATMYGNLAVSGEISISAGDTINPSDDDHSYYLTYDASEAEGEWGAYNTAVDGGVVTFTNEPYEGVEYDIHTTADEVATVVPDDFSQDGENWTVNISDQVETAITEVDQVQYFAQSSETSNHTIQLQSTFDVVTFTDEETGEEHDSADYEQPSEPQDDSNYITQEQWEENQERTQELIDQYENQSGNGGGGGINFGGDGGMILGIGALGFGGYLLTRGDDGGNNRR